MTGPESLVVRRAHDIPEITVSDDGWSMTVEETDYGRRHAASVDRVHGRLVCSCGMARLADPGRPATAMSALRLAMAVHLDRVVAIARGDAGRPVRLQPAAWEWLPGVKAVGRRGKPEAWFRIEERVKRLSGEWADASPATHDPATNGAMTMLVRELLDDPFAYVAWDGTCWRLMLGDAPTDWTGVTEFEALYGCIAEMEP